MENLVKMNKKFWKNKKVFITGHTGFKGAWLSVWLHMLGAKVKGYSLEPNTEPSLFKCVQNSINIQSEIGDIRNIDTLQKSILSFNPELIIHMAAQPLVRLSYKNPIETYEVNVIGTANILEASRNCDSLKAILNVTTDKCYHNKEIDYAYKEFDALGGYDPYSSSKAASELVTSSYRNSYFNNLKIGLASARAGNVIGGGDWSEDRLVPDIFKSIESGKPLLIRNPSSIRPWQHVLEPLAGYLTLLEALYNDPLNFNEAWNFGPEEKDSKSVEWIVNKIINSYPDSNWSVDKDNHPHEANTLKLDISKAKNNLSWKPRWNLEYTIQKIIDWHKAYDKSEDILSVCSKQIEQYSKDCSFN